MYDPDLADRMEDIDPQFRALLREHITTFIRWDILRFFVETNRESAPLDEIAAAVGREPAALLAESADLVRAGFLGRRTVEGTTHYVITQERRRRAQLETFLTATHDREFRLKVIYHLLHPD
ncbi:MAG: hypothetical protein M5U01_17280 [Ardenticatenaceae bacterium]|nr:hypothetical protein [Ardenticatenaceae bacterium]HBY93948.1 hypothetical protein [Chloroflexota bacterium]